MLFLLFRQIAIFHKPYQEHGTLGKVIAIMDWYSKNITCFNNTIYTFAGPTEHSGIALFFFLIQTFFFLCYYSLMRNFIFQEQYFVVHQKCAILMEIVFSKNACATAILQEISVVRLNIEGREEKIKQNK